MLTTHGYIDKINIYTDTIAGYNATMTGYKNEIDVYIGAKGIYRCAKNTPNPPLKRGKNLMGGLTSLMGFQFIQHESINLFRLRRSIARNEDVLQTPLPHLIKEVRINRKVLHP